MQRARFWIQPVFALILFLPFRLLGKTSFSIVAHRTQWFMALHVFRQFFVSFKLDVPFFPRNAIFRLAYVSCPTSREWVLSGAHLGIRKVSQIRFFSLRHVLVREMPSKKVKQHSVWTLQTRWERPDHRTTTHMAIRSSSRMSWVLNYRNYQISSNGGGDSTFLRPHCWREW